MVHEFEQGAVNSVHFPGGRLVLKAMLHDFFRSPALLLLVFRGPQIFPTKQKDFYAATINFE